MKKAAWCSVTAFAVALVVGVLAGIADANPWDRPSGWHYNLELIAVPKDKTVSGTDGNGHRIFIKLFGNTKILLTEGDFQVLDFNGTDGQAAFSLPANPCVDSSGNIIDCPVSDPSFQCYSVWVAELGKPCTPTLNNETACAVMQLCGDQNCVSGFCSLTGQACTINADCQICSLESVLLVRNSSKPNWRDVTKELTTLCLDLIPGGSGCDTRIALFGDDFADFFWSIDNAGLRHAQLRFYPETGDVCGLKPSSK